MYDDFDLGKLEIRRTSFDYVIIHKMQHHMAQISYLKLKYRFSNTKGTCYIQYLWFRQLQKSTPKNDWECDNDNREEREREKGQHFDLGQNTSILLNLLIWFRLEQYTILYIVELREGLRFVSLRYSVFNRYFIFKKIILYIPVQGWIRFTFSVLKHGEKLRLF